MIDSELLNNIKADAASQYRKKEGETDGNKKQWIDRDSTVFLSAGLFVALIVFAMYQGIDISTEASVPPTRENLESEYAEFFEKPCLKSSLYGVGMVRTEGWRNQVKQIITGQAKGYYRLSGRKEIYEKHLKDCRRLITSGVVQNMTVPEMRLKKTRTNDLTKRSDSRTNPGSLIEKGADIDYRIDSDKIIRLSVNMIRSKGYRCNSVSSIKLYKYPERIEVKCNGGRDRYKIQRDSAGLLRQVAAL